MSFNKSNLSLAVACAALAIPTFLQLRAEAETFVDVARIPLMFDGFTADNVGSFVLGKPLAEQPARQPNSAQPKVAYRQLAVQLTDAGWVIGKPAGATVKLAGAPAMKSRVEVDVFEHLRSIRKDPETLVQPAATDAQLVEYGLDEEHAFVVRCLDRAGKAVVAEVLVGKDASERAKGTEAVRGVFVRQRGDRDVVLYECDKPWRRSVKPKEWLDRALFRLDPDKARSLSIRNVATKKRIYTFERSPNQMRWTAKGAGDLGAVRQSEVEGLLQRLRYVAAQSFERPLKAAGDMQSLGLFPPQIELVVAFEEAGEVREIQFAVGGKVQGRNENYLTCSKSQFLMTWPASLVAHFELDVAQRMFDPKPK